MIAAAELESAAPELEGLEPEEILRWGIERWRRRLAICTSFQAEGMALFDMAWRIDPAVRLFTVDTGRLPQETYEVMEQVRERYGTAIEVYFPDARKLERMTTRFGPDLFRRSVELRERCCEVRKVRPLARALAGFDAWVTGLRRDQSPSRRQTPVVQVDRAHGGLAKIAPLVGWTRDRVWEHVREHDLERHPLYERGYRSIGCAPCTRAVGPDEDERAGRWWWEESAVRECGLHWSGGRLVRAGGAR